MQPPTINSSVAALRFFFNITADRPELARYLSVVPRARKLPVVLSDEEVARLLDAAPGIKYKAALSVAYGAGLRVSEVRHLRVSDVDSKRMVLRIEQGKGGRDRYAMLSPRLLELLREWWLIARPQGWLLPGRNPVNPTSSRNACSSRADSATARCSANVCANSKRFISRNASECTSTYSYVIMMRALSRKTFSTRRA